MKNCIRIMVLLTVYSGIQDVAFAQKNVLIDIGHGQVFYNNPNKMNPIAGGDQGRVAYITIELNKNLKAYNADLTYSSESLTSEVLSDYDLLMVHVPSAQYTASEVKAVKDYLNSGGALFLVMDGDYWTTLEKTNVNDLVKPFDISFGGMCSDQTSGGHTQAGNVTDKNLKISYHGSRLIAGGKPFCFSNASEDYVFGVYKELSSGGKIIAMGDGMTSLYMTSWDGVSDYQCSAFMEDVFGWLLKD